MDIRLTLSLRVIGWVLQSDQVSSKSERELVSRLPGPLVDTVLRLVFLLYYQLKRRDRSNCWTFIRRRRDDKRGCTLTTEVSVVPFRVNYRFVALTCSRRLPKNDQRRYTFSLLVYPCHKTGPAKILVIIKDIRFLAVVRVSMEEIQETFIRFSAKVCSFATTSEMFYFSSSQRTC